MNKMKPEQIIVMDCCTRGFIEGAAKALFVSNWADEQERQVENGTLDSLPWPPGSEIMNYAPGIPLEAYIEAGRLLGILESANNCSVFVLCARAALADNVENIDYELFGHCVAMQAMGHGVSWFDDHAKFEVKIPHFEFRPEFEE